MKIEILKVEENQKSVLRQMLELYEYDFSEFNDNDINEYGFYGYKYFDHYWTEPGRHAFFIKVDGKYAGFVMVNSFCYVLKEKDGRAISEFFIMRKYRRSGIGRYVATKVFDMFPGKWEIAQHGNNDGSKLFWKKVIENYTNNHYKIKDIETEEWQGQVLIFDNSQK